MHYANDSRTRTFHMDNVSRARGNRRTWASLSSIQHRNFTHVWNGFGFMKDLLGLDYMISHHNNYTNVFQHHNKVHILFSTKHISFVSIKLWLLYYPLILIGRHMIHTASAWVVLKHSFSIVVRKGYIIPCARVTFGHPWLVEWLLMMTLARLEQWQMAWSLMVVGHPIFFIFL